VRRSCCGAGVDGGADYAGDVVKRAGAGRAYPLLDGISSTIGWEFRSEANGGLGLVILRHTGLGRLKVVERFR
jgi:hypothetical protein